ncbi:MAG TPA: response regulator transcription factor [Vicinamibacterales bacterium]|nr:response regulator transcription factor [Vicinamibacterales bacterium]
MAADAGAILLVDDDVELCVLISEYLGGHGYGVSAVHDGAAGLRCALDEQHDLVILDVMLPVLDGFEVLRQLRKRSQVPVVMLTARSGEHDRVEGFVEGVDDYLVKPFAAAELLGRVRAVLRRTAGASAAAPRMVDIGHLRLDTQVQEGFWKGAPLGLTATEFAILDVITRASGRVVSRDELSAVLHQRETTPYERSLDVHVSHLRKKLDACGEVIIHTVRGIGYLCSIDH